MVRLAKGDLEGRQGKGDLERRRGKGKGGNAGQSKGRLGRGGEAKGDLEGRVHVLVFVGNCINRVVTGSNED